MTRPSRTVVFLQANSDRRRIYAVATGEDGVPVGYGPLSLDQVDASAFESPYWEGDGQAELAADLAAIPDQYHPLDDFYRAYGYPADTVAWAASTPASGRDFREVAAKLDLDPQRLFEAGQREGEAGLDAAGDAAYHRRFGPNWAITNATGQLSVDPSAYRFKAWLSLGYLTSTD